MSDQGYGQALLLDWSAYTRYLLAAERGPGYGRLDESGLETFEAALVIGQVTVCHPFRVETLYSERNPAAFDRRSKLLDSLPQAGTVADAMEAAVQAQAQLAASKQVSHRVKFPDLVIAAIADRCGLGVLQYDRDYDTIAGHSGLTFPSVWIAEPGSIN